MTSILVITLLVALAITSTASTARVPASKQAWQFKYHVWMPGHWQRLAQCESGSNPPNWTHSTDYEGAFGFAPSTWRGFKYASYPDHAYQATPWQQYRVARRLAAHYRSIRGSWGCWRGSDHAWVRGGLPEYGTWR